MGRTRVGASGRYTGAGRGGFCTASGDPCCTRCAAKRSRAPRRSSMLGESASIIISALMKLPYIPEMPSGDKRRLLEDFLAEFPNISTDPAWNLVSLTAAFVVWLEEESHSPPSNYPRGMVCSGLFRGFTRAPQPERPSPKGNRGYVQPEAAEVISSDEHLRVEWSALNDGIRSIYEVLGPPPLKMLSGVRDGR